MTDAEELAAVYVVANTPAYLFKRLRDNAIVLRWAQASTSTQLAEEFSAITTRPQRTAGDVASAYALLVAIGLRDYSEARRTLSTLDVSALDWGERIRAIIQAKAVPTLETRLEMPRPKPATTSMTTGSTTFSRASVPPVITITDVS